MNFLVSRKAVYKLNTAMEIIIVLMSIMIKRFLEHEVIYILSIHIVLYYSTFVFISGSQLTSIYHVVTCSV